MTSEARPQKDRKRNKETQSDQGLSMRLSLGLAGVHEGVEELLEL